MSLEHLDDPAPPEFDASRWQRVTVRSRAIVRGRRYRRGAVSLAVVAAIGIAAGWSVLGTDRTSTVHVSTPVSTSTTFPTPTTQLNPSDWVTVEVQVNDAVVTAGQDVTGVMVFDNHLSRPVQLTDHGCASKWTVVVGAGKTDPGAAFASDCPSPDRARSFAPGETRIPFRAPTTYAACGDGLAKDGPIRPCVNGNQMPLLPVGDASVWFETSGTVPHLVMPTAPIPIQIVDAAK